eukprot:11654404-Prorocentrum_lima.AAC.1
MNLTGLDLRLRNGVGKTCAGWYHAPGHMENQISFPWIRVCFGGISTLNLALYFQATQDRS